MTRIPLAMALALMLPAVTQAQDAGARLAEAFVRGETDLLWAAMDSDMQALLGGPAALTELRAALEDQGGRETALVSAETSRSPLGDIHLRLARRERFPGLVGITVTTDAAGRITGFYATAQPAPAASTHEDYQSPQMRLPFDGAWLVFWGGRRLVENYHAVDPGQRFALDLVVARDGATHAGDPALVESYHCWGQPILAPAAGVVAAAEAGLPDQPIGSADPTHPAGNHVVLEIAEGAYVFLAHMQADSVTLAPGDSVAAGDRLGLCGNSGNTSEPHLHMHMQTTPDLGAGEGLPMQFVNWLADGVAVETGEPVRGMVIAPAE